MAHFICLAVWWTVPDWSEMPHSELSRSRALTRRSPTQSNTGRAWPGRPHSTHRAGLRSYQRCRGVEVRGVTQHGHWERLLRSEISGGKVVCIKKGFADTFCRGTETVTHTPRLAPEPSESTLVPSARPWTPSADNAKSGGKVVCIK